MSTKHDESGRKRILAEIAAAHEKEQAEKEHATALAAAERAVIAAAKEWQATETIQQSARLRLAVIALTALEQPAQAAGGRG